VKALRALAAEAYPREACAFVMESGAVVPAANRAADPTHGFEVAAEEWAQVEAGHGKIEAFFHSHPDGPDCPSAEDMRAQQASGVPWLIGCAGPNGATTEPFWFGDGSPPRDYLGRGFRHGVTDCYSLIRDWLGREVSIHLPDYPRSWEWWLQGGDLYRDHLGPAGFREVGRMNPAPGDLFLVTLRSKVPNHGLVYVGNGLVLHHLASRKPSDPSRLSRREPLARWAGLTVGHLRWRAPA